MLGNYEFTPLQACLNGHLDAVKWLVEHDADKAKPNSRGCSPFYAACYSGHLEIAKYLCSLNVDCYATNSTSWTPLQAACYNGHLAVVKWMMEECEQKRTGENSQLMQTCAGQGHASILEYLIQSQKFDLESPSSNGSSCFYVCCLNGKLAAAQLLAGFGANIEKVNTNGCTPFYAVSSGSML